MTTPAKTQTNSDWSYYAGRNLPKLTKAPFPVQISHTLRLEERSSKGKALRDVAARKAQMEFKPPANRADPVDLLIENSKGRMEELIPIRYGRMMVSPFTFYRGAAAIMASDLSHTPSTGLTPSSMWRLPPAELWRFRHGRAEASF